MGQIDVVLTKPVTHLGEAGEIRTVKRGYFRNYLLPKGKARYATREAVRELDGSAWRLALERQQTRKAMQDTASRLDGLEISIDKASYADGRLYESVTNSEIHLLLLGLGIKVKREILNNNSRIKTSGHHIVAVELYPGLTKEITVIVNPEIGREITVLEWFMTAPEDQLEEILERVIGSKLDNLSKEFQRFSEEYHNNSKSVDLKLNNMSVSIEMLDVGVRRLLSNRR